MGRSVRHPVIRHRLCAKHQRIHEWFAIDLLFPEIRRDILPDNVASWGDLEKPPIHALVDQRVAIGQARGSALVANGFLDEGFALLAAQVEDRKSIWLARPHEERRLRDYAVGAEGLADQLGNHQRFAEACPNWRQALLLYAMITKAGHLAAQDQANDITPMRKNIAAHCQ